MQAEGDEVGLDLARSGLADERLPASWRPEQQHTNLMRVETLLKQYPFGGPARLEFVGMY